MLNKFVFEICDYICFVILRNEMSELRAKIKPYTAEQERLARYGKALSHPVRVFVMDFLANNLDKCCYSGDTAEQFELPVLPFRNILRN